MSAQTTPPAGDRRRSAAADRRRAREALIIAATRELFDARGVRDAQIEDVAKAVGINRAIIYRHFTGKEELFALTLVTYLDELRDTLTEADSDAAPDQRLQDLTEAFIDYGLAHPAFVDCGVTIMRMGPGLLDELSPSALFRLGRGMAECLAPVTAVLAEGKATERFGIDDPDLVSNMLYSLALGGLQFARLGVMVKEASPGFPEVKPIDPLLVKAHLLAAVRAVVFQKS